MQGTRLRPCVPSQPGPGLALPELTSLPPTHTLTDVQWPGKYAKGVGLVADTTKQLGTYAMVRSIFTVACDKTCHKKHGKIFSDSHACTTLVIHLDSCVQSADIQEAFQACCSTNIAIQKVQQAIHLGTHPSTAPRSLAPTPGHGH